jgi:hypothetical protein
VKIRSEASEQACGEHTGELPFDVAAPKMCGSGEPRCCKGERAFTGGPAARTNVAVELGEPPARIAVGRRRAGVAGRCRTRPLALAGFGASGNIPGRRRGGEVLALHTVGVFAAATAISRGRFCPPGSRESHDCAGLSATGSMLRTNCRAERIWRGRVHKRRARGNRMHYEW